MSGFLSSSTLQLLETNLTSLLSISLSQPGAYHLLETPSDQRSRRAIILKEEISETETSIQSVLAIARQVTVLLQSLQSRKFIRVHALQSLVHALPTELMKSIFEITLESNAIDSRLNAALILSRVCSTWRSIALTTPNLWSTVEVTGTQALTEIIKRSRPLPLNLSVAYSPTKIQTPSGSSYITHAPWPGAIEDQDVKRLSSLHVQGPSLLGHISIPNESNATNLVYLELMGKYAVSTEHVVPSALRSPRVLDFNFWPPDFASKIIKGVWPRVQQIRIRSCSSAAANAILNAIEAPLLERLEFHSMEHSAAAEATFHLRPGVRWICMSDSARFASQSRRWMRKFPGLERLEVHLTASDAASKWWELVSP
ncbi:hypothetical protein DL93DRAFT_1806786 [Clavulina sp. PMI_390]|nr:hypothetical protein DL93DRAFT_1806786 [Clavulina sp. PMI_390]